MNLFEQASREQWRFATTQGILNVEDLWGLKLESLDKIAKTLNKEVKDAGEESFIAKKTLSNKTSENKLELVKFIIADKLEEQDKRVLAKQKAEKRAQILELIGKKEINALEGKTIEELKQELAALD